MASGSVSAASIKQNLPHHIKANVKDIEGVASVDTLKKIYLKLWQEQVAPNISCLTEKDINALRCQILGGISDTKVIFEQLVEALNLQGTISAKNIPRFNQTKSTEEAPSTHMLRFTYGVYMPVSRGGGLVMSLSTIGDAGEN